VARAAAAICLGTDPAAALATAFRDAAGGAAHALAAALEEQASSLAAAFRQISDVVAWTAGAPDLPWRGLRAREVPVPALPDGIEVPGPGAECILGRRLARAIVARRLERVAGPSIRSALESYAAVLRRWALDALEDIRNEWTAATGGLRAEVERRLGHAARSPVDRDAIRKDLERISNDAECRDAAPSDGAAAAG
jgi:hypothetical protein